MIDPKTIGMTDPKGIRTTDPKGIRTLDVVPNLGEMIKPSELIDISGAGPLTLSARRLYNLLVHNAFGPGMAEEGREFEILLADVKGTHAGNDRIEESILAIWPIRPACRAGCATPSIPS
jgi:hypothetical protein